MGFFHPPDWDFRRPALRGHSRAQFVAASAIVPVWTCLRIIDLQDRMKMDEVCKQKCPEILKRLGFCLILFGDLGEPHQKKNTVAHLQLGMVYGIGFTT